MADIDILTVCERFDWHYIMGIEPGKPEDFSDLRRALAAAGELAPRHGMVPLVDLAPQLADTETRSMVVPYGNAGLPADTYVFDECYCTDPACDCRRVLVSVFSKEERTQLATINYAFDSAGLDEDDPERLFLDPLNPQTRLGFMLLVLFEQMLEDDEYRLRLGRHYEHVKALQHDSPIRRIRAPKATVAPRLARAQAPGPNPPLSSGKERVFVFDPQVTRLLGEVASDRWERAIATAGGQVARAAATCGIADMVPGARVLRGRSPEDAMAAYLRAANKKGRSCRPS